MSAFNDHTIFCWGDITSHSVKVGGNSVDTVGFLHFQFGSVSNDGGAFRVGSHNGKNRKLINESRNQTTLYRGGVKLTAANQNVRMFLSAGDILV